MNAMVTHLFVYGSLRQGFQLPIFDYIKTHFNFVSMGQVQGRLFDLGEYPAAVPGDGGSIIGELYEAKSEADFCWAISQLDDYEGLHPEAGETALYTRALADVHHNGGTTTAWIYWYNRPVEGCTVIESGDVLAYFKSRS